MDTKLYDMDSPYTSLTLKNENYIPPNLKRRHNRLLSLCVVLSAVICILSTAISVSCAVYCLRVSNEAMATEQRIASHIAEPSIPHGHAEALRATTASTPGNDAGIEDLDDENDDDNDDYEEDYDDSDESLDEDEFESDEDEFESDEDETESDDDEFEGDEDIDISDDEKFMDGDYQSGEIGLFEEGSEGYLDSGNLGDDEDDSVEGSAFGDSQIFKRRLRRATDTEKPKKGKKNKGKGKKPRTKKPKMGKLRFLPAAQFDGSVTNETIKQHCPEFSTYGNTGCVRVTKMEGTLCNNHSFIPDEKNQALRILKSESWVNENTSPVTLQNSVLTVKSSGVHLVYAQVMFSGYESRKSASVVVRSGKAGTLTRRLSCNADMSSNDVEMEDIYEKNLVTCSIFGLMQLNAKDKLELQTGNRYAPIERIEGATYFGIVQLNKAK